MKRIGFMLSVLLAITMLFTTGSVRSQSIWETLWVKSAYPLPAHQWMYSLFPSLAYDRVRDKLYVLSIKTIGGVPKPEIFVFNPSTGDSVGKLRINYNVINSGFSNGMYCLFKMQVAKDGSLYACNLVSPPGGTQGDFKIFKWEHPDSLALLVFSSTMTNSNARWGDAFGVAGTRDSTFIFVSGGSGANGLFNNRFSVLKATDTSARAFTVIRNMISSLNGIASHGIAPTGLRINDGLWVNSIIRVTSLQSQSSPPITIDEVPSQIDRITSGTIRYFELTDQSRRKFILTSDGANEDTGDSTRARLIDVSDANAYFLEGGEPTPPINNQELGFTGGTQNNAQDVDYRLTDENRLTVFVLMSNNGFGAYRLKYTLPVELAQFRATLANDVVDLRWLVTQETNNYGFEVERSIDGGKKFKRIAFIPGRGSTNQHQEYRYSDPLRELGGATIAFYRLKQIDVDGKHRYIPTVQVLLNEASQEIALQQNYPNPVAASSVDGSSTTIAYRIAHPGKVQMKLFNQLGQEARTLVDETKDAGTHVVKLETSELPPGMYHYQLFAFGKTMTRKMILMK